MSSEFPLEPSNPVCVVMSSYHCPASQATGEEEPLLTSNESACQLTRQFVQPNLVSSLADQMFRELELLQYRLRDSLLESPELLDLLLEFLLLLLNLLDNFPHLPATSSFAYSASAGLEVSF